MRPLFLTAMLLVAGCNSSQPAPSAGFGGIAGRAQFALDRQAPLAVGAQLVLGVTSREQIRGAASSDESVLQAHWDAVHGAVLSGRAPGTAELRVFGDKGHEIDRLRVSVAPVRAIDVQRGWPGDAPRILVGQAFAIPAHPIGDNDQPLIGCGSIHAGASGVVQLAPGDPTACDYAFIVAASAGTGAVALCAGDVNLSVPVRGVSREQITDVVLTPSDVLDVKARGGADNTIHYQVLADGHPVYGAACDWRGASVSVAHVIEGSPDYLGRSPEGWFDVTAINPGMTHTACWVNGHTAALTIHVTN